jgi:hypothetical protein
MNALTSLRTKTFTFHVDPGHGWLGVSEDDIALVGLSIDNFTRYSYRCAGNLYLEEDCDAAVFVAAFIRRFGEEPRINEVHSNRDSLIRQMHRIGDQ